MELQLEVLVESCLFLVSESRSLADVAPVHSKAANAGGNAGGAGVTTIEAAAQLTGNVNLGSCPHIAIGCK